jgi:hypothetical protein
MSMRLVPWMVVLVAAHAWAGDGSRGFRNADITGNYSWLAQGSAVVSGTPRAFPIVIIGTVFSDGHGTMHGTGTVNPGGPASGLTPGQSVSLAITYEVEADGTGQWFAAANPSDLPAVVGSGAMVIGAKDEVHVVSTQLDRVISTTVKKQHPPTRGFSKATLRGAWAFTCHGALVTATGAPPTPVIVPVAVIGLMTNDGHGTFSAAVTANTNGVITHEDFTGKNEVSRDGLVSATATSTDPLLAHLSGVVDNRHEFRAITTDPGRIVSCTFTAQGRPDEDQD